MSDIPPPTGIVTVQRRDERPPQDADHKRHEPPPEKVAETYEETARGVSDTITILGIPVDMMTTQVRATVGGLVSAVEHLRSKVKRYESLFEKAPSEKPVELLVGERFFHVLDKALAGVPPAGQNRQLALVVVNTYEDIRKSSGLLAANSAIADVVAEIQKSALGDALVGLVGGPTIALLLIEAEPVPGEPDEDKDAAPVTTADRVRAVVEAPVYSVSGLDMKLSFTVASIRVEAGLDALQAVGQADHVLRS